MTQRNRRSGVEDRWTRSDGAPSVTRGKGLRWRARYVDDQGREHAKGFGRRADAQRWLDEITAAQVTGTYTDPALGKVTLRSFYREWSTRQVWVPGSRSNMNATVASVPFADVALADLRISHIESWVSAMTADLAPSTIRTRFANVRAVIRAAIADRYLSHDVTKGVRLPRTRKVSAAMRIPAAEQVGMVIRVAEPQFAALIAVCAFGGLRLGEASALKVSDVDFLRGELHVRRQVQYKTGDGRAEIRAPKCGSDRTVYIPEGLVALLAEHVRRLRPGTDPDRWLFPGGRDETQPVHVGMVSRGWAAARDAAGISYRLHDLRHFYASGLIAAGCDVVTTSKALGHASATTTLATYSHLWPDANDRTRRAAGELLDAALGTVADGSADAAADALRTE
jgi:integrase